MTSRPAALQATDTGTPAVPQPIPGRLSVSTLRTPSEQSKGVSRCTPEAAERAGSCPLPPDPAADSTRATPSRCTRTAEEACRGPRWIETRARSGAPFRYVAGTPTACPRSAPFARTSHSPPEAGSARRSPQGRRAARRQCSNQPLHRVGQRVQFPVDGVVHADVMGSGRDPSEIGCTKVKPNRGRFHGWMGPIAARCPKNRVSRKNVWPSSVGQSRTRIRAARSSESGIGGPPQITPRKMVRSADRQIVYAMTRMASGRGIALHQG